MSSSDIYGTSGRATPKREHAAPVSQRRRRARESFDDAVNKEVSGTHQRRSRNTGFRRFQHLLKQPEFSRKFWIIMLSVFALILILLLLWDRFFRYPQPEEGVSPDAYRTVER